MAKPAVTRERVIYAASLLVVSVTMLAIAAPLSESLEAPWVGGTLLVLGLLGLALGMWLLTPPRRQPARPDVGTPAGWYRDPSSPSMRFWDGTAWTDQRAPLPTHGPSSLQIGLGVAGGLALFVFIFGR